MTRKRKVALLVLFGGIAVVIAAGFFLPIFSPEPPMGLLTDNRSHAAQVGLALGMYAEEHGAQFPNSLQELMPKYLESDYPLWNTVANRKVKAQWQYSPGHKFNEEPQVIVLTSQPDSDGNRVVVYSNCKASIWYAQQR